jgi:hypothetical protein
MNKIDNSLTNWQHFDHFFRPILAYCGLPDSEPTKLLDCLINLLTEASKTPEMVLRGNFNAVFELLHTIIRRNPDCRRRIASTKFSQAFQRNESTAYSRAILSLRLQENDSKIVTQHLDRLASTSTSFPRPIFAGQFAAAISFHDSQSETRVRFFFSHFRAAQQSAFITEILRDATKFLRAHNAVGCPSLFGGTHFFDRWIATPDISLRFYAAELIYALFPSFPRLPSSSRRPSTIIGSPMERENIIKLFHDLLDLRKLIIDHTRVQISRTETDLPTTIYFELLGWTGHYSGVRLLKHRQTFLQMLTELSQDKTDSNSHIVSCLKFFSLIGNDSNSLDENSLKSLLNSISHVSSPAFVSNSISSVITLITPLAREHPLTIVGSPFFQTAMKVCQREQLQGIINAVLNSDTVLTITQTLWSSDIFNQQMSASINRCCEFVITLFKKFPIVVNIFESENCYKSIVTTLHYFFDMRQSLTDYATACLLAETLAEFVERYTTENRGKKSWMFFNRMSSFIQFWNSNQQFLLDLISWVQMSAPVSARFSILCLRVIEGALSHDPGFSQTVSKIVIAIPPDFLVRVDPAARCQCFSALLKIAQAHGIRDLGRKFWFENFSLLLRLKLVNVELAQLCLRGTDSFVEVEQKKNSRTLWVLTMKVATSAFKNTGNLQSFSLEFVKIAGKLCKVFGSSKEIGEWANECGRVIKENVEQLGMSQPGNVPKIAGKLAMAIGFRKKCEALYGQISLIEVSKVEVERLQQMYAGTALDGPLAAIKAVALE